MTTKMPKRVFWASLLVLLAVPAWAGSIGIEIGSGGGLTFKQRSTATPVWGNGNFLDFGVGKASFPAIGRFSFHTGRLSSSSSSEWIFGAGGNLSFAGCVDLNGDGDSAGHCDKNDLRGKLFTGSFVNAKIVRTGTNTYKLNGEVMLTPTPGAATELGTKPFIANLSLRFTDNCVPSSPASCRANIISGQLVAPEPTAFLLLGLGMLLAGLGHSTLSFFRAHA